MVESQTFWPVECDPGAPNLFVCMECLNEVFRSKIPMQGCPDCRAVSTFEPFTLESIQEWGSEDLIAKAQSAEQSGTEALSTPEPAVSSQEPQPSSLAEDQP